MNAIIANVLKQKLSNLDWIERFGGMVTQATKPVFVTVDGQQVITGYKTYPVSCWVNEADCWNDGVYNDFAPDSRKSAIAFFTDSGGVSLREQGGPGNNELIFSFELRFLCWMNTSRLGSDITAGRCDVSGRVVPYVISQFFGTHSAAAVYGADSPETTAFQRIEVKGVRQLPKSPSIFDPFSFDNRGLFLFPYDYFGLVISGIFTMNKHCLPALYDAPFVATDADCVPDYPVNARVTDSGQLRKTEDGKTRVIKQL